jgi:hypothetical protein
MNGIRLPDWALLPIDVSDSLLLHGMDEDVIVCLGVV